MFVDDVVDAFVLATKAGGGRRLNIGTAIATSVRELHTVVAAATGAPDEPTMAEPRTGELQAISLDASAAGEVLGWAPKTDFESGVRATVDWLRATS